MITSNYEVIIINTKQAFDKIEKTLSDQSFILGRDYKIEHYDVQNFIIHFCNKKPNRELNIKELYEKLGGARILKFTLQVSYFKNRMVINLRLPVTEDI